MFENAGTMNPSQVMEQLAQAKQQMAELQRAVEQQSTGIIQSIQTQIKDLSELMGVSQAEVALMVIRPWRIETLDLAQQTAQSAPRRARTEVEAKYRNPTTGETWSGRGRKPAWVAGYVEQGGDLNDLLINREHAEA